MIEQTAARRDYEWNDLNIILTIGRAGSLSGAARALGKTHSTIFRNIKAIEQKTGVRFFDSFDHGYVPTDAGRTAIDYAERIEAEVHALGLEVLGQDAKLSGRVRLTCPEAFASDHAPVLIAAFIRQHPDIQVDIGPGHGALDLNRREAEVANRATKAPPESAFGRKICAFRFALYASPDYLEAAPDLPVKKHPFCLIEGSAAWLVPLGWKSKEHAEKKRGLSMSRDPCRSERRRQGAGARASALLHRRPRSAPEPRVRPDQAT